MKVVIEYIQANWPIILEGVLFIGAYFFTFLSDKKVKSAKTVLTTLFKSGVEEVNAKSKKLSSVEKRLEHLEKTMDALLTGNVKEVNNEHENG